MFRRFLGCSEHPPPYRPLLGQCAPANVVEEVLPEDKDTPADLIETQAVSLESPPPGLPYAQPALEFRDRVNLVGPDKARQKF